MAKAKKQTKAEIIAEQVAETVGAGKELRLESVDFSDPNRPKTCLEIDFPILPINQIAQIEGNAGKPIYQMSKWWARRRSSVFRSMLIAAASKAPEDPAEAAKLVWESYYGNHQNNPAFKELKVADIFMGGGTTLVEGSRLGMQMYGNDLNPVAWLVVKNELATVDLNEVNKLFDFIEREVKPQIMPFYACEGPNGEKGTWTHIASGKVMGDEFDPLNLKPEERKDYRYEGPEVIYTFWAKHGPCAAPGCGHRTPLMSSPVVAVKTLSVATWHAIPCSHCHQTFDIERQEARMAPNVPLAVADTEEPYAIMDDDGYFTCPHCGHRHHDAKAAMDGESSRLLKKTRKNKRIELTLLVHPDWLKGAAGSDEHGALGGTANSSIEATQRWNKLRASTLRLLEVRGNLPEEVTCPETGVTFSTSEGTIPKKSHFTCQEDTCGRQQDILDSMTASKDSGPLSPYTLQCFSETRKDQKATYAGRFFKTVEQKDISRFMAAYSEWQQRQEGDLSRYWPKTTLPEGFKTTYQRIPEHGYPRFVDMFNARQLLGISLIAKAIDEAYGFKESSKEIVIGAFQQYLRNQNMYCFWNPQRDTPEPLFSNNNYHPKATAIENSVFSDLGRGNWASCVKNTMEALNWCLNPWELVSNEHIKERAPELKPNLSGKSEKVYPLDAVKPTDSITCGSSTELASVDDHSIDLVITDPPFGNNIQYSELADFFYVWLQILLSSRYSYFHPEWTPKSLEVVTNPVRNIKPDDFFERLLTECWRQANRILKPAGILAFTFHHSEDGPWVSVLESLFKAGFYLEATYPIRSDETKGEGAKPGTFGSQLIEYDILHVCRKLTDPPTKISWARLRRQILADVRQLQGVLEHHQNQGLPKADIQVIKRGKALEYFSRHYGQVYVEEGREFTVKEALVGINQLLDDQSENESGGTPVNCEPITRQFLRIFAHTMEVPRDQMQKFLRGTGMAPSDFINRGWSEEKRKIFYWSSPLAFAQEQENKFKHLHRDMDQAMVLVGACFADSGINVKKLLGNDFKPHAALGDLLNWLINKGGNSEMRQAAITAKQLYTVWAANNQQVIQQQLALFDLG